MSIRYHLDYLRRIWASLSKKRRKQLLILQFLSLFTAFAEVANISVLLPFLTLLSNPKEELRNFGVLFKTLTLLPDSYLVFVLGFSFILIIILSTSLRAFTITKQLRLTALIGSDFANIVFASAINKPYSWHLENASSSVLSRLTNDVNILNGVIQSLLVVMVNIIILVVLGTSLIAVSPVIMITITFLLSLIYVLIFQYYRGSLSNDGYRNSKLFQSSLSVAQGALGGIRDVILDHTQEYFTEIYSSKSLHYRLALASINTKAQIPRFLIEGFSIIIIATLSILTSLNGQPIQSQLPLLGVIILGSYRILHPLQQTFSAVSVLQSSQASIERLKPFLTKNKPLTQNHTKIELASYSSSTPLIEIRNVCFSYQSTSSNVLNNINFSIYRGECVALVGTSGSGKSTISDLILGLLRPISGNILIHGYDLYQNKNLLPAWQQKVAHVPQNIYLGDSTFEENIAFGVHYSNINKIKVEEAARLAEIKDLIESSDRKYLSLVGEQGVKLSGGQRQRVGLARALYKNAELLVLDEATSALDTVTESRVMNSINSLDSSISILMIAHRLSTIQNCDRIIVIEKGKVVGSGNFNELISTNKSFQRLVNMNNPQ